jgi:hypothetical protein
MSAAGSQYVAERAERSVLWDRKGPPGARVDSAKFAENLKKGESFSAGLGGADLD